MKTAALILALAVAVCGAGDSPACFLRGTLVTIKWDGTFKTGKTAAALQELPSAVSKELTREDLGALCSILLAEQGRYDTHPTVRSVIRAVDTQGRASLLEFADGFFFVQVGDHRYKFDEAVAKWLVIRLPADLQSGFLTEWRVRRGKRLAMP